MTDQKWRHSDGDSKKFSVSEYVNHKGTKTLVTGSSTVHAYDGESQESLRYRAAVSAMEDLAYITNLYVATKEKENQ